MLVTETQEHISTQNRNISAKVTPLCSQVDREALLIDAVKAGNLEAFEQLVSGHRRRIFRLAHSIMRNEADAEDVVQDSFMQAFVHLSSFHGHSKFSTWLTSIAINESLLKLRLRRRRACEISFDMPPSADDGYAFEQIAASSPSPEQTCSYHEQRELVRKIITSISPGDREVLQLRLNEDLSYTQIAQILGLSDSAVRSRMHRTRVYIRDAVVALFGSGSLTHYRASSSNDSFSNHGPVRGSGNAPLLRAAGCNRRSSRQPGGRACAGVARAGGAVTMNTSGHVS